MKKLSVTNLKTNMVYEMVTQNHDCYGKIDVLDFHGVIRRLEVGEEREDGFKLMERCVEYSWDDFSDVKEEIDYTHENRLHA